MDEVSGGAVRSYDPVLAIHCGRFVELAYQMYNSAPSNPKPNPPSPFPAGYKFIAWVQMKDFLIENEDWSFYGLLAQGTIDPSKSILAIRGTSNLTEWWDDLTSMGLVPFEGFGSVGYGFDRIYRTLRIVDYMPTEARSAEAPAQPPAATFAHQVAAAVQRHAATIDRPRDATPEALSVSSVEVTGHSLGGALATLYVAENAAAGLLTTPLICTFASPRVGDPVFATKFDQLGITSWRIVNEPDIVPKLPFLGFSHVETSYTYNSASSVTWSLACWHSLSTYLHLLDPNQPLDAGCRRPPRAAAAASLTGALPARKAALSERPDKDLALETSPDSGATINITIKIGRKD
jgi:Lipase (class 3)